jgi:hypothetical protein
LYLKLFTYLLIASPGRRERKEVTNPIGGGGLLPPPSLPPSHPPESEREKDANLFLFGRTPASKENKYTSRRGVMSPLSKNIKAPLLLRKRKWGGGRGGK